MLFDSRGMVIEVLGLRWSRLMSAVEKDVPLLNND